jgi:cobalt-precorrin-5B (C1)-methyltransferase
LEPGKLKSPVPPGWMSMMPSLRKGFTTGTAAAAAAKAAILRLQGESPQRVSVALPDGGLLEIEISKSGCFDERSAFAEVVKDAGDDPDVTDGIVIRALVRCGGPGIRINGGTGVGRVTKPGLPVALGEAAINPVPRRMIERVIRESPFSKGLEVVIEVPEGETVARRTLNARLGIEGGISIIGSTGIVEPMSESAWQEALQLQLKVAQAAGFRAIVLTPGRQGAKSAELFGVPANQIAETGNFIGLMLDSSRELGFEKILFWGYLGKLVKVAGGSFNTHNKQADGRMETLAALAALHGAGNKVLDGLLTANTMETALIILEEAGLAEPVLDHAAERLCERARERSGIQSIGCVMLDRSGRIRGCSQSAKRICEAESWPVKW